MEKQHLYVTVEVQQSIITFLCHLRLAGILVSLSRLSAPDRATLLYIMERYGYEKADTVIEEALALLLLDLQRQERRTRPRKAGILDLLE